MTDCEQSPTVRDRASLKYDASYESGNRKTKTDSGNNLWRHLVLLQVHYFTLALQNAGIAYSDLIYNSVLIYLVGEHIVPPINKITESFITKHSIPPCDLPSDECLNKINSLYGVYINFCKI